MPVARLLAAVISLSLAFLAASAAAQEVKPQDHKPGDHLLAQDLKLLQGKWEMLHGNEGRGEPTIRSVKEIEGNRETLRRYDARTGQLTHEHSVEFTLSRSGDVRVCTFYAVGGDAKDGLSFVYKVDAENFYDIPGLLDGDKYRNYQQRPRLWHWKRVKKATPPPEIPAPVLSRLEIIGAKVTARPDGYGIDIRRKTGFTDKEIELILACPQVVDLTLEKVEITDQGLAQLRALPDLSRLILNDCPISAEGLKILAELPLHESLVSIGLRGTKLKDDDLQHLKDFPKLERVDLSQTEVTDASLPYLQMLPLKALTVTQTKLTAAALDELQQKRPNMALKR